MSAATCDASWLICRAATLPLDPPFSAMRNASPLVQRAVTVPVAFNAELNTPVDVNATFVALIRQLFTTFALAVKAKLPPLVTWGTSPEQVVSVTGRVPRIDIISGCSVGAVNEKLGQYLEENPKVAKIISSKAVLAAEAREALSFVVIPGERSETRDPSSNG